MCLGGGGVGESMSKTAGEPCNLKMHIQYNVVSGKQILSSLQTKEYKAQMILVYGKKKNYSQLKREHDIFMGFIKVGHGF